LGSSRSLDVLVHQPLLPEVHYNVHLFVLVYFQDAIFSVRTEARGGARSRALIAAVKVSNTHARSGLYACQHTRVSLGLPTTRVITHFRLYLIAVFLVIHLRSLPRSLFLFDVELHLFLDGYHLN
jgi:hypothetical protein